MSFDHAIKRKAELAANILSMYTNVNEVTKKVIGVEEFQKSYTDDTHTILTEQEVKYWADSMLEKSMKIEDVHDKKHFEKSAANELSSFEKISVVADNGNNSLFFVKSK